MKAVMISTQPQWCCEIANYRKSIEVRKTLPKLRTPFKCYIYCTNAKPYLAWADVFRGNWETEIATIHGYSRKAAEKIWDIFNGSVIGEFVCDYIFPIDVDFNIHDELPGSPVETWLTWEDAPEQYQNSEDIEKASCLSMKEIEAYIGSGDRCYCWHISKLQIYDEPKPLGMFYKECAGLNNTGMCWECESAVGEECDCSVNGQLRLIRPPQSWCYVDEM